MGGEAGYYHGVEVNFIHGKEAILTVYNESKIQETIKLSELKDRGEMHNLMRAKGFVRKSDDEIYEIKEEMFWAAERNVEKKSQRTQYYLKRSQLIDGFKRDVIQEEIPVAAEVNQSPNGLQIDYLAINYDKINVIEFERSNGRKPGEKVQEAKPIKFNSMVRRSINGDSRGSRIGTSSGSGSEPRIRIIAPSS